MLLSDFAQWFAVIAGASTLGMVIGGPVGAVIGILVGIGLRLGATGQLPRIHAPHRR
jgi:hypothetical protein